ncbi:MAG TPA: GNAT family N-acetyltransferase [Chloroflexota bacterium]|nr:GNAT family N-acetyltransferase [Chloroflexota bacterium]
MEIRQLTHADAAEYRQLRLRGLREDPEAFGTTYDEELARPLTLIQERLRGSAGGFTLGAFDGTLIGVVTLVREVRAKSRHRATVIGMYVAAEVRGRGVGRALLVAACARARQIDGLEQLHLAVVTTNAPARHLYRSLGFQAYGLEPRALKLGDRYWDEELMVLYLRRT